ncbi:hypothetical protein ACFQDN_23185 [Pseudomonas asuensis]|uniref:hypothetical protein n=1 Tax=Pseudomonas asuensis TaxID=1825787 RepID=UPI00166F514C|nr:hypothetical protein [Pseudomonas asuensis]
MNAKETQGNPTEKWLAGCARQAIGSGQLQISSNPPENGIAQFGMRHNQDVLVIKAKWNDPSGYDLLSVGFRRGTEKPISMTLPKPNAAVVSKVQHPSALMKLPNELLLQIGGGTANRGEGVNLGLRSVNKQMKVIANDQMSAKQRFLQKTVKSLMLLATITIK